MAISCDQSLKSEARPLEDLEKRMAAFDEAAKRFENERRTAGDLLAGDRRRALQELEAEAERLRTERRAVLERELVQALASSEDVEAARTALTSRIIEFFDKALKDVVQNVGERLPEVFSVHQRRADQLITLVRKTAADLLEIPFRAPKSSGAFEPKREPFWVTTTRTVKLSPIPPGAVDYLLPAPIRRRHLRRRLLEEIN